MAKIYDKYNIALPEDHMDAMYYPLELKSLTLKGSKMIDINGMLGRLKARLHGMKTKNTATSQTV